MRTITLEVSDFAAEKIEQMSATERKTISEALDRIVSNRRSLEEIMKEASEQARKNGLTPELLDELLSDELAEWFNKMNKSKRDALIKILLDRITSSESLSDLLEFSALQAEKQGMTPEILKQLLKKE